MKKKNNKCKFFTFALIVMGEEKERLKVLTLLCTIQFHRSNFKKSNASRREGKVIKEEFGAARYFLPLSVLQRETVAYSNLKEWESLW